MDAIFFIKIKLCLYLKNKKAEKCFEVQGKPNAI